MHPVFQWLISEGEGMASHRRFKLIGVAGLIAVLLSGLTMGAFAENNEGYGDVTVQGEDDALQHDAEVYAEHFRVDVETAKRNLQLQRPAGELQAELYENEADTYAGQWLDHGDDFRLIVWFTDGDVDLLQQYNVSASLLDVIELREAEYSLAELRSQQEEAGEIVDATGLEWSADINIKENRAEIWVTDQKKLQNVLSDERHDLPEAVAIGEVDTLESSGFSTVDHADNESADQRSGSVTAQGGDVYGGLNLLPECTTGFAVQHSSGARGFLSAGHCDQGASSTWGILGPGDTVWETPLQNEWFGHQLDVQWHTTPNHTLRNWVLVSNDPPENPTTRVISGEVPLLQQQPGEWVCAFGTVTGYQTCGQIQSTFFQPSWSTCSCFVRVQHPDGFHLGQDGDSGGPWYSGNNAYGVISGGVGESTTNVYYMPTSSAAGVPELTVLTSCPGSGC